MNGKDVQKRRRAVKFSRIPKPLSPSDHDGTFVAPRRNASTQKTPRAAREPPPVFILAAAGRARGALTAALRSPAVFQLRRRGGPAGACPIFSFSHVIPSARCFGVTAPALRGARP